MKHRQHVKHPCINSLQASDYWWYTEHTQHAPHTYRFNRALSRWTWVSWLSHWRKHSERDFGFSSSCWMCRRQSRRRWRFHTGLLSGRWVIVRVTTDWRSAVVCTASNLRRIRKLRQAFLMPRLHLTCSPDTSYIYCCTLSPSTCILCRRQNCRHGYMYPLLSASRTLLRTCIRRHIDGYRLLVRNTFIQLHVYGINAALCVYTSHTFHCCSCTTMTDSSLDGDVLL